MCIRDRLYNLFPWITGLLGLNPQIILDFFPYAGEEVMQQSFSVSLEYILMIPFNFSILAVHMWYIYLLIGLYLYLPVFSAWVEKASERAKLMFLLAWGVTLLLPYYYQFVSNYLWGCLLYTSRPYFIDPRYICDACTDCQCENAGGTGSVQIHVTTFATTLDSLGTSGWWLR